MTAEWSNFDRLANATTVGEEMPDMKIPETEETDRDKLILDCLISNTLEIARQNMTSKEIMKYLDETYPYVKQAIEKYLYENQDTTDIFALNASVMRQGQKENILPIYLGEDFAANCRSLEEVALETSTVIIYTKLWQDTGTQNDPEAK